MLPFAKPARRYVANGGDPTVLTNISMWPDIIRKAYSAAWNHDNYELMVAWTRANIK